jgi:hypothetical protein
VCLYNLLIFVSLFLAFPLKFIPSAFSSPENIHLTIICFDRADTLYLCYCIDKEMGERKREEVFIAVRSLPFLYFA